MNSTADKLRIIVVFRADLPEMTRAKGEVQFGHAVDGTLEVAESTVPERVAAYRDDSRVKLSMEVDDLAALRRIEALAARRSVPHFMVTDAGHTCFSEPMTTCLGLGPMSKTDGNALTRDARMRA